MQPRSATRPSLLKNKNGGVAVICKEKMEKLIV